MLRKKVFVGVLVLALLVIGVSSVLAEEVKVLTVQEAIRLALEENIDLKIANLNLENGELEYQKNQANNLLNQSKYAELNAEYSLANAKKQYQQTSTTIVTNILLQYSNVILSEMNIEIQIQKVQLEEQLLGEVKKQVEMGDKGRIDLLQQEIRYKNATFNLEKARDVYQQNLKEIRLTLGLDEENIKFSSLGYPIFWEITQTEMVAQALENDIDLKLKEQKLELAQIDLERMEVISTSPLDQQMTENKLEIARLELTQAKEKARYDLEKDYNNLTQAMTNLTLAKENLQETEENYQITRAQKEAGLKTAKGLLEAEISLLEQKRSYQSAIFDYYQSEVTVKQAMGIEIEVLLNEFTSKD